MSHVSYNDNGIVYVAPLWLETTVACALVTSILQMVVFAFCSIDIILGCFAIIFTIWCCVAVIDTFVSSFGKCKMLSCWIPMVGACMDSGGNQKESE